MKKTILLNILCLLSLMGYAQKETANWTFGAQAGLTWNTTRTWDCTGILGTPDATLTGLPTNIKQVTAITGNTMTFSDKKGNLLFYSDGYHLYDKNHNLRPQVMTGEFAIPIPGLPFPYPGDKNKTVMVTVNGTEHFSIDRILCYSVWDQSLQGGLGGIVPGKLNIPLEGAKGYTRNAIAAVAHDNGEDYWITVPGFSEYWSGNPDLDHMYLNTWLFTGSGEMSATPLILQLPYEINGRQPGMFRFTEDGTHFFFVLGNSGGTGPKGKEVIIYGDFDSSTGTFSNIKEMNPTPVGSSHYFDFNADGSLLYLNNVSDQSITVYKADELWSMPSHTTVTKKVYSYKSLSTGGFWAVQRAIDNRIYITEAAYPRLMILDNIDDFDNLKIYHTTQNIVNGEYTEFLHYENGLANAEQGFPTFPAGLFRAEPEIKAFGCTGNTIMSSIVVESAAGIPANQPVKLTWDFGDGSPTQDQPVVSGQTEYSLQHTFNAGGRYTVTVTPYKLNGTPLKAIKIPVNITDCAIKTNRMIRTDLQNEAMKKVNR